MESFDCERSHLPEARLLPKDSDSRLKGYFGNVSHPTLPAKRTYCFHCGRPAGFIAEDSSLAAAPVHVVVTCNTCDETILNFGKINYPLREVPRHLLDAFGIIPEGG